MSNMYNIVIIILLQLYQFVWNKKVLLALLWIINDKLYFT